MFSFLQIQSVFSTSVIQTADQYLTELPKSYLYPVISHAIKCAVLATFKDILLNSQVDCGDEFQSDVLKLAEKIVKEGTTVLRGGGVSSASIKIQHDGLLYIVKSMCTGVELLVWSAVKHEGIVMCPLVYSSVHLILYLFVHIFLRVSIF